MHAASPLSGLEQLRAMIRSERWAGIGATMDFHPVSFEAGLAVFEGHPDERVYNVLGSVHGGYAATLLDTACGCAVQSRLVSGQTYTTLDLKVSYLKAITTETGVVRVEGRLLSIGRRVAFAEAKLMDATGRLLASASSTLLVMTP